MDHVRIIALVTIGMALFIAALSIPLILRKVPMNHVYGVRFRASFQSERHWYEMNAFGGKVLLLASLPIFLSGGYGVIFPEVQEDLYLGIDCAVIVLSVCGSCILCRKKAKELETKPF